MKTLLYSIIAFDSVYLLLCFLSYLRRNPDEEKGMDGLCDGCIHTPMDCEFCSLAEGGEER